MTYRGSSKLQDELFKSRVLLEADMTIHGVQYVDVDQVKSYCSDLRSLLSETDIVKSKAFLRSFVEKVVIDGSKCTIRYKLPVPTTWQESEDLVLPTEPSSGACSLFVSKTYTKRRQDVIVVRLWLHQLF